MMEPSSRLWAIAICLSLALAGCAGDQAQVNRGHIDVSTSERTITIPVLTVAKETRQVTVPFIDINPPAARGRAERVISIEVNVPHAGYELQITEIRASGDDLWVIGRVREIRPPAAHVMTRLSDRVAINAPEDLDIRRIVVGERPEGINNNHLRFVESMDRLEQIIPAGARLLYRRNALPGVKGA